MRRSLLLDTTGPTSATRSPSPPAPAGTAPAVARTTTGNPGTGGITVPSVRPTADGTTAVPPAADDLLRRAQEDRAFDDLVAGLAPCRWNDPELWFAEQTDRVEEAKALCRGCPLVRSCLAGAIERAEPWGVWGGEVFVDGVVVARKRGRGRPRKTDAS